MSSWVSCCCTDTGLSSGMHWGSLVKFQGGGVVVKFDVFSLCYAVCLCCLHASKTYSITLLITFKVSKQLNWWL